MATLLRVLPKRHIHRSIPCLYNDKTSPLQKVFQSKTKNDEDSQDSVIDDGVHFEPEPENEILNPHVDNPPIPRLTILGVGGGGGNAVNNMIARGLSGVEFLVCNTDAQHLSQSLTDRRIQIGHSITHGLGCGANPEVGEKAAIESIDQIMRMIEGSNMVFIAAGMGGGTGTGAAPVIAKAATEAGILTVSVVTTPYSFEGPKRSKIAQTGIQQLLEASDTLIVVPNQNLLGTMSKSTTFVDAFRMVDNVLFESVRSITDLLTMPGQVNVDFADVQTVMKKMGHGMVGTVQADGDDRAMRAVERALTNPLLQNYSLQHAKGILLNIIGGSDLLLSEVESIGNRIMQEMEDPNCNMIFGHAFDPTMEGKIRVSIIATGL